MNISHLSKIIVGAALVAALSGAAAGAANATVPSDHERVPAAAASLVSPLHATEKVPFTSRDVWNIARYSYDRTLVHNPSYLPLAGGYAADIESYGGFASEYRSPAEGNVITLAVAKAAPGTFAAEEAGIAARSTEVSGYGPDVQVYELNGGGTYTGDFEIFTDGGYWISTTSNLFATPGDAAAMIQATLQTIPAG